MTDYTSVDNKVIETIVSADNGIQSVDIQHLADGNVQITVLPDNVSSSAAYRNITMITSEKTYNSMANGGTVDNVVILPGSGGSSDFGAIYAEYGKENNLLDDVLYSYPIDYENKSRAATTSFQALDSLGCNGKTDIVSLSAGNAWAQEDAISALEAGADVRNVVVVGGGPGDNVDYSKLKNVNMIYGGNQGDGAGPEKAAAAGVNTYEITNFPSSGHVPNLDETYEAFATGDWNGFGVKKYNKDGSLGTENIELEDVISVPGNNKGTRMGFNKDRDKYYRKSWGVTPVSSADGKTSTDKTSSDKIKSDKTESDDAKTDKMNSDKTTSIEAVDDEVTINYNILAEHVDNINKYLNVDDTSLNTNNMSSTTPIVSGMFSGLEVTRDISNDLMSKTRSELKNILAIGGIYFNVDKNLTEMAMNLDSLPDMSSSSAYVLDNRVSQITGNVSSDAITFKKTFEIPLVSTSDFKNNGKINVEDLRNILSGNGMVMQTFENEMDNATKTQNAINNLTEEIGKSLKGDVWKCVGKNLSTLSDLQSMRITFNQELKAAYEEAAKLLIAYMGEDAELDMSELPKLKEKRKQILREIDELEKKKGAFTYTEVKKRTLFGKIKTEIVKTQMYSAAEISQFDNLINQKKDELDKLELLIKKLEELPEVINEATNMINDAVTQGLNGYGRAVSNVVTGNANSFDTNVLSVGQGVFTEPATNSLEPNEFYSGASKPSKPLTNNYSNYGGSSVNNTVFTANNNNSGGGNTVANINKDPVVDTANNFNGSDRNNSNNEANRVVSSGQENNTYASTVNNSGNGSFVNNDSNVNSNLVSENNTNSGNNTSNNNTDLDNNVVSSNDVTTDDNSDTSISNNTSDNGVISDNDGVSNNNTSSDNNTVSENNTVSNNNVFSNGNETINNTMHNNPKPDYVNIAKKTIPIVGVAAGTVGLAAGAVVAAPKVKKFIDEKTNDNFIDDEFKDNK